MNNAMKWFWPVISAALPGGAVRAGDDGAPPLVIWDLPAAVPAASAEAASRRDWHWIDPDALVRGPRDGGVALEPTCRP